MVYERGRRLKEEMSASLNRNRAADGLTMTEAELKKHAPQLDDTIDEVASVDDVLDVMSTSEIIDFASFYMYQ